AGRFEVAIPLEGALDISALAERLRRDLKKVDADLQARRRKLASPAFVDRAPAEIVEKERRIESELDSRRGRLSEFLAGLSASWVSMLDRSRVDAFVRAALAEDLGDAGDRTTEAVVGPAARARGRIVAREPVVVAGGPVACAVFRALDAGLEWSG